MEVILLQTTDALTDKEIQAGEARKLRDLIRRQSRTAKGPVYILLVGALDAGGLTDPAKQVLPPLRGTVSRMKRRPSDNGYGCPGKGVLPAAAVGRFPARTPEEARQMVAKTLAYENDRRPGPWRRQLTILAGAPGFGQFIDQLLESMVFRRLTGIDPAWTGRAIYHNPSSRIDVPAALITRRARAYVEAGQALTLYLGHSGPWGFGYMSREDWAALKIARGPGIFVTFGCYGCQVTGKDGSYGLAAMRNPGGPVAVVGSLGECYSAMVFPAADALTKSLCGPRPPRRLGEAWSRLKQALAHDKIDPGFYQLLDLADGNPNIPQATQRLEHLEMFVLFGDPALQLPALPADIGLTCEGAVGPGRTVIVRGKLPARLARARVEVSVARGLETKPVGLRPVPASPPAERDRVMLANHERSNGFTLVTKRVSAEKGDFVARVILPAELPWPHLIIRAYAHTDRVEGLGVLQVRVGGR
jgi:hypothetical protein